MFPRTYADPKPLSSMREEVERLGVYCTQDTYDFYKKITAEHPEMDTGRIDWTFDKYIAFMKEKENVS